MRLPTNEPAKPQADLQKVQDCFRKLATQFSLTADQWVYADLSVQDSHQLAASELTDIFNGKRKTLQTGLATLDRLAVHELRGRIAIVTNAVSLIGKLEKGPDRVQIVYMVKRNLHELASVVGIICNQSYADAVAAPIELILMKTQESLQKLTCLSDVG